MFGKTKRILQKIKSSLFENRSIRQTVTKNIFWLTISQLGSRLIRASVVIYAARVLGAADYGVFSYALGLAGFFTIFSDIGVSQTMTREAAKNPDERSNYFATSFWIKLALLFITGVIILVVAPYMSKIEAAKALIPLVALLVIFDGMRDFASSFFRALEKMEWEAIVALVTNLMVTVSGFIVLYYVASVKILTFTYVASIAAGAILAIFVIRKEFYKIFSHSRQSLVKPILETAFPIGFQNAIGAFMLNTDLIMLGWWQSAAAIGYYSAGQKIVQFIYILPAIVASAVFPTLARLIGQKDKGKIRLLMEKSMASVFLIAAPMAVGGLILAKPIIEFIYGHEFLPAVTTFQALMFSLFLVFPGTLIGNAAIAHDKQKQITKYLIYSAVANAVFDAIFIPIYGIVGSAFATLIALVIDTGLCWRLLKKVNNFYTFRYLKKIIMATIIMGVCNFILNKIGLNVIANIIVSAMIYLGALILLKEKLLHELAFLKRVSN